MNGTDGRIRHLVLILFCFIACSENAGENVTHGNAPPPGAAFLKGHAVFGHEVRTIRPCGEEDALWAVDSTQLLRELHGELAPGVEPYEEVFVVVRGTLGESAADGFGADYPGSFYVDRVLYAAGEGWGCDLDLSRFQFQLSGNEPFWSLVVTDSTVELNRMDAGLEIWNDAQSETTDDRVKYFAEVDGERAVAVTIWREPCRDSMSGAYHAYSASVMTAGEELLGCAIRGTGH